MVAPPLSRVANGNGTIVKKPTKPAKQIRREKKQKARAAAAAAAKASESSPDSCSKDMLFYFETYHCPEKTRDVMTRHGVVHKLLETHIKRLQDKAWSIFPYPCIGLFEFIQFNLPLYPAYPRVLSLLRSGGVYLDVGCCVGQELRYLHSLEGIRGAQLFGCDLHPQFLEIGHELFMDAPGDGNGMRLQAADIFDDDSWTQREMVGRCAVVHASYFLHLFGKQRQLLAAKRLVAFLKRKKGNMIVGRAIGSQLAGEYTHPTVGVMMRHDHASFIEFWKSVAQESALELAVECNISESTVRISEDGKKFDHPPGEKATDITFSVTIV